jgi:hypothetical protein
MLNRTDFTPEENHRLHNLGWNTQYGPSKFHHFGGESLQKFEDGSIEHNYWGATNVDPDDASYDNLYITWYFASFEDFLIRKESKPKSRRVE